MKTKQITLTGKYLNTEIPTNTIFLKNLTGIGATHIELNIAKRNSIIIEPNVPVIIGKTEGREDVLGIYEGITKQDVERYLRTDTEYKKIVTTPESFSKVISAFEDLEIDYLNTYFMLIDECEKLIRDADYRKTILYPLDYFFKFKDKAFVSATAIIPSDPRFKENRFSIRNVVPTYDITRDLNVVTTNHSLSTLNRVLQSSKADKVFIFLNSVVGSSRIIKSLKIESLSSIFTSTDKVKDYKKDIKDVRPNHVTDMIDEESMSKYNFLTSRYFSAVDINIDESVDIVIISDTHSFEHSIIDPNTDLLQIIGRIRNKEKVSEITFIANVPNKIKYAKEESIENVFAFGIQLRDFLKTASFSTDNEDVKDFIDQIVQINGDKAFFNKDFTANHFMMDNYRHENKVKSFYRSEKALIETIENACIRDTKIKYFKVTHTVDTFDIAALDLKLLSVKIPFKDKFETIIQTMESIKKSKKEQFENRYQVDNTLEVERKIITDYPEMYEIFLHEGANKLREIGKTKKAILYYYYLNHDSTHLDNAPLILDLYREFKIGQEYIQREFLDTFFEIFEKYNKGVSRELIHVERFYEIKYSRKRLNGEANQTRMIKIS
jgi:hypothetical protein